MLTNCTDLWKLMDYIFNDYDYDMEDEENGD